MYMIGEQNPGSNGERVGFPHFIYDFSQDLSAFWFGKKILSAIGHYCKEICGPGNENPAIG